MGKGGRGGEFVDKVLSSLEHVDTARAQACLGKLSREKGFLESIFNSIHEGILVVDSSLKIKYANKAAVGILGLPEDFEGERISKFLREIDWRRLLKENADDWFRLSRQEVEVFYPRRAILSFYVSPHKSAGGMATVIVNDITESVRTHLEDAESQRTELVSTLAAGVAHEIGNPLNSLNIHLQLLERSLAGTNDADSLASVRAAKSEIERLDRIVTQFLKAVRPVKPRLVPLDLRLLIEDTLFLVRPEMEDRGVSVSCQWPDDLPSVMGDGEQLKQVLYNLLRNACEAMTGGGAVHLDCSFDHDFVRVSVADEGVGIPEEAMGDLFKPYRTTKVDGCGLGLMIVQRVVRDHGADLSVRSAPDGGAVFTISFPRRDRRVRLLGSTTTGLLLSNGASLSGSNSSGTD